MWGRRRGGKSRGGGEDGVLSLRPHWWVIVNQLCLIPTKGSLTAYSLCHTHTHTLIITHMHQQKRCSFFWWLEQRRAWLLSACNLWEKHLYTDILFFDTYFTRHFKNVFQLTQVSFTDLYINLNLTPPEHTNPAFDRGYWTYTWNLAQVNSCLSPFISSIQWWKKYWDP